MGLHFKDDRMTSPRVLKNGIPSGEHEVIATLDGSDFHIGVFCFERLKDDTVVNKGYYHNDLGEIFTRKDKDMVDIAFMEYRIDREKLQRLFSLSSRIEHIKVETLNNEVG